MSLPNQTLLFRTDCSDAPDDTFLITKLDGVEAISQPFRFELELLAKKSALPANFDLRKVLYRQARIGFRQGVKVGGERAIRTRWVEGVLESFEQVHVQSNWWVYRAVLVPKLKLLDEQWRSRVFLESTISSLVRDVLKESGLSEGQDFELADTIQQAMDSTSAPAHARPRYPVREYVAQYEESDLNFVSRWLEQEGVFYTFHNESEREKVVFGDSTASYRPLRGGAAIPFRPEGSVGPQGDLNDMGDNQELFREQAVRAFSTRLQRLPQKVVLYDYNWRSPDDQQLKGEETVYEDGFGEHQEYNDHFKNDLQGLAWARTRAQELQCRAQVWSGESDHRGLRPGFTFELNDHPRGDWNRTYLLTEVRHTAEQVMSLELGAISGARYSNSFRAIPDDVTFRPERVTDWPTIHGVVNAFVDAAAGKEEYADIDELGRYKVRIAFDRDLEGREAGSASRYVRMAQPYAGEDSGMHFPLLKGTEVLLIHIDGDPDRPVIVGAVPNPNTVSPIREGNHHANKIQTTSGNGIELDDQAGDQGIKINTSGGSVFRNFRSLDRTSS